MVDTGLWELHRTCTNPIGSVVYSYTKHFSAGPSADMNNSTDSSQLCKTLHPTIAMLVYLLYYMYAAR